MWMHLDDNGAGRKERIAMWQPVLQVNGGGRSGATLQGSADAGRGASPQTATVPATTATAADTTAQPAATTGAFRLRLRYARRAVNR